MQVSQGLREHSFRAKVSWNGIQNMSSSFSPMRKLQTTILSRIVQDSKATLVVHVSTIDQPTTI